LKTFLRNYLPVLILACAAALANARPAYAAWSPAGGQGISQPSPTVLRIIPVGTQPLGKIFTLSALLTTPQAQPVGGGTVNFLAGGVYLSQARTNGQGIATILVNEDFEAKEYTFRAIFEGNKDYDSSSGSLAVSIQPADVVVQTVPPLEGIQFRLNGNPFVSGADGSAHILVSKTGTYALDVLTDNSKGARRKVDFSRWEDEVYNPTRLIKVPSDKPIQVGFEVSYQVGQNFVDLQNQPVDLARILSITLKSSQGSTYTFADGKSRWLPASLVTRRAIGLDVVPIQYSVMSVMVDGSNVVSQAQQRFYPHPGEIWPVQLLLFSVQVSAKDTFLGSPLGTGVALDYPDGSRQKFLFDKNHSVTIQSLARGIYHVQVIGASGFTPSTPVALSQNEVIALDVLSRIDIFAAVTLAVFFALGLVVIGRMQILGARPRKPAALRENVYQPQEVDYGRGDDL
jgi:hypothetical protein